MNTSKEPPQKSEKNNDGQILRKLGIFAVIVTDLVAYSGIGIALGYFATKKWGAPWWVILVTSGAGMALAFYKIYQLSKKEL